MLHTQEVPGFVLREGPASDSRLILIDTWGTFTSVSLPVREKTQEMELICISPHPLSGVSEIYSIDWRLFQILGWFRLGQVCSSHLIFWVNIYKNRLLSVPGWHHFMCLTTIPGGGAKGIEKQVDGIGLLHPGMGNMKLQTHYSDRILKAWLCSLSLLLMPQWRRMRPIWSFLWT